MGKTNLNKNFSARLDHFFHFSQEARVSDGSRHRVASFLAVCAAA